MQDAYDELVFVEEKIARATAKIEAHAKQDERAQLLMTIPGIGIITASAFVASIGDIGMFSSGR